MGFTYILRNVGDVLAGMPPSTMQGACVESGSTTLGHLNEGLANREKPETSKTLNKSKFDFPGRSVSCK